MNERQLASINIPLSYHFKSIFSYPPHIELRRSECACMSLMQSVWVRGPWGAKGATPLLPRTGPTRPRAPSVRRTFEPSGRLLDPAPTYTISIVSFRILNWKLLISNLWRLVIQTLWFLFLFCLSVRVFNGKKFLHGFAYKNGHRNSRSKYLSTLSTE